LSDIKTIDRTKRHCLSGGVNAKEMERLLVSRLAMGCLIVVLGCVVTMGFMIHSFLGVMLLALCAGFVGYAAAEVLKDLRKEKPRDGNPD